MADVGGRLGTEIVDGYRCDLGFQLINPAYPEARRVLDLAALVAVSQWRYTPTVVEGQPVPATL